MLRPYQPSTNRAIRFATEYLLPGLVYFVLAQLSFSLLTSDSFNQHSTLWPPAGVAVASVLLVGYRAGFSIFFGAIAIHYVQLPATPIGMLTLTSIATVVQPCLTAFLVKYALSDDLKLDRTQSITKFLLLCGPVGAAIFPSYFILYLFINNIPAVDGYLQLWTEVWFSTAIGCVVFTPLTLILCKPRDASKQWNNKTTAAPLFGLFLIIAGLTYYSTAVIHKSTIDEFETLSIEINQHVEDRTAQSISYAKSLKFSFEGIGVPSEEGFRSITSQIVDDNNIVLGYEWIERVEHSQRKAYEKREGHPITVHRRGPDVDTTSGRQLEVSEEREIYFPITYEYLNDLSYHPGFDLYSLPAAKTAIDLAIKYGNTTAVTPTGYTKNGVTDYYGLYLVPVYQQNRLLGLIGVSYKISDYIGKPISEMRAISQYVAVKLYLESSDSEPIYTSPSFAQTTIPSIENPVISELALYNQQWDIHYFPTKAFISRSSNIPILSIRLCGLVISIIICGWILAANSRTRQIEQEVEKRTAELQDEIEERKKVEKELQKLSLAVENSPSMVMISNTEGTVEYINAKFTEVTGFTLDELKGRNAAPFYVTQTKKDLYQTIFNYAERDEEWRGEVYSHTKEGQQYWAEVHTAPIFDEQGNLKHLVSVHNDITENKVIHEQLSYQASHDQLTGLINRYELERVVRRILEMHTHSIAQGTYSFMFIDLDQFKIVNDTSGHAAGDELLRQIAPILISNLRKNDTVARLGGDEFAIVAENCSVTEAERIAEKIRADIEQFRFHWDNTTHTIGATIGIVAIDETCHNWTQLLKHADSACYTAKDAGRNRIHVYHPDDELVSHREHEINWITEIRAALDEGRFTLFGQIILPLQDTDELPSIETLVRMVDKEGNIISPGSFLPAAERYGLTPKIDLWVVENMLRWISDRPQVQQLINSISINLSGLSLGSRRLHKLIVKAVEDSNLPTQIVKFEITETAAIANLTEAQRFINATRNLGFGFSLDDFGSGLSSFGYLKNLPVDTLKIDGMFVRDILDDVIDFAMVKSINDIGHVLEKKTIAEFVENEHILSKIRDIGVDYAQGYAISRPKPLNELLDEISAKSSARYSNLAL